jgi:membrane protease YdiL (CAAX protease family)
MNFHIPCLRYLLVLYVIVFPSAYIFFLKTIRFSKKSRILQENIPIIIVYLALLSLGCSMGLIGIFLFVSAPLWYIAAAVGGGVNILLEYIEASVPFLYKGKGFPCLSPVKMYATGFRIWDLASIIVAAGLEETVFRQFMLQGLFKEMSLPLIAGILLSSFFYGINHVYFGSFAVFQKITSGIVFSCLFVFSGYNLLIPVICHMSQNIILYCYSSLRKDEMKKGSL